MAVWRKCRKAMGSGPVGARAGGGPVVAGGEKGGSAKAKGKRKAEDGDGVEDLGESPSKKASGSAVLPGGGRKGISSGLSTVVKQHGLKTKTGKGLKAATSGGAAGSASTNGEWWKELPAATKGGVKLKVKV